MTEREMGTILATLETQKEQLDRIEGTVVKDREELLDRVSKLEAWQGRLVGAVSLGVFVIPISVGVLVR